MRNILIYFAIKYHGDYQKILNAIKTKEKVQNEDLQKIKNIKALTIIDENYPLSLKNCYMPPFVIFYQGDISLINEENLLSVVGSRNPSDYGVKATKKVLNDFLSEYDCIIVSGLAKGIDTLYHQIALKNKRKLIGDASIRSGTQITVKYALEYGKEILAIPHEIFSSSFCNELIKQGAMLVSCKEDIAMVMF